MITSQDEQYILTRAYVPEHIINLMVGVSKGEPFLKEDYLIFMKDNWLILVGYPLDGDFSGERCERILKQAVETFRPEYLWFIGPEIPASLLDSGKERQTDQYYPVEQAFYMPTWVEWSILAGCISLFMLLYTLFTKVFPIVPIWEIREGREKAVTMVSDRVKSYLPEKDAGEA